MDTVVSDVVTTTATKVQLNKHFLVGFAAGVTAGAAVVGGVKLKQKLAARRKNVTVPDTIA